jgi:hypothetical protein
MSTHGRRVDAIAATRSCPACAGSGIAAAAAPGDGAETGTPNVDALLAELRRVEENMRAGAEAIPAWMRRPGDWSMLFDGTPYTAGVESAASGRMAAAIVWALAPARHPGLLAACREFVAGASMPLNDTDREAWTRNSSGGPKHES